MQRYEFRTGVDIAQPSLLGLYAAVGWVAYTSEERRGDLVKAVANSSFVASAWADDQLIGLARVVSDDVAIFYLQDLLVHPDHQRRGIGGRLMSLCLERYAHVRSRVLLTDDEDRQRVFYEKMGFRDTCDLTSAKLNTFVQMDGVD